MLYLEREDSDNGNDNSKVIPIDTKPVDVGRGDLEAKDKKCSRRQVAVAPNGSSTLTVTAHGVNPSLVSRSDGSRAILRAGESAQMSVGDKISLLCDGTHTFVLRERKGAPTEEVKEPPKWSWLDDDGWAEYPGPLARKLEVAYNAGEKECPVDAERFVDLVAMEQKRRDNPTKRRKVKREAGAQKATAVIHFAQWSDIPFFLSKQLEARKDVQLAKTMSPAVTHVVAPKTLAEQKKVMSLLAGAESHGAAVVTYGWIEEYARTGKLPDPKAYAFPVQKGVKTSLTTQSPQKAKKTTNDTQPTSPAVMVRPGEHVVWMWKNDDGAFVDYSKEVSDKIERAYQITGPNAPETVDIGGKWYVDLRMYLQCVHGVDGIERQVMRETRVKK